MYVRIMDNFSDLTSGAAAFNSKMCSSCAEFPDAMFVNTQADSYCKALIEIKNMINIKNKFK